MTISHRRGHEPSEELIVMRRMMDKHAPVPDTEGVTVSVEDADGVEVWRFTPENANGDVALLHFHGGGYRLGSPKGFARYFARVAGALGQSIYAPKYRLSPDTAYPGALEDAVTVYRWLVREKGTKQIFVGGDSAGGGLAAALLLQITQMGLPAPDGAALFSAWLDLRVNAESYDENSATDQLFSRDRAEEASSLYLQGADASDPLASPVLGEWKGQPPLLIHVSDIEVLRDDSLALAKKAEGEGVQVQLERFSDTQHVWHNAYPETPQSMRAVDTWRAWLEELFEA